MITKTRPPRNLNEFSGEVLTDNVANAPYKVAQTGQEKWEITFSSKSVQITVRAGKMRVTNQPWSLLVQVENQREKDYREKLESIFDELIEAESPFSRGALASGRDVVTIARGLAQIREQVLAGPTVSQASPEDLQLLRKFQQLVKGVEQVKR
ncbi:MAG: hypothetical protein KA314_04810 [Chloroflexi bacterium]|nr:hypothetical protein [Chloroflexota bacterium]